MSTVGNDFMIFYILYIIHYLYIYIHIYIIIDTIQIIVI
jgi:hypothetical protein